MVGNMSEGGVGKTTFAATTTMIADCGTVANTSDFAALQPTTAIEKWTI